MDNSELLEGINVLLKDRNDYVVQSHSLNPEMMTARIIEADRFKVEGEDLHAGFQFSNSDVGRASITVELLIYKSICTNGMILGGGKGLFYYRKHVGATRQQFIEELTASLGALPNTLEFVKRQIQAARKTATSEQIQQMIDQFKDRMSISDAAAETAARLVQKYEETPWGVMNAITELAQEFSLTRRIELERYAGNLLTKVRAA
jgi:hypothetical protein